MTTIHAARELYEQNKYRLAIAACRKILKNDSTNASVRFLLGLALYEQKHYKDALVEWKAIKKAVPDEENVSLNIGYAHQMLGNNALASKYYKDELLLNPLSKESLYNLGNLYYNAKQFKKATGYLQKCHVLKHSIDDIIDRLANCYSRTGQGDKERELYQDFLSTRPNDTWALQNLGAALMDIGEYNRALLLIRKADALDPNNPIIQRNLQRLQLLRSSSPSVSTS